MVCVGLGAGAGATIVGELSRTTRTKVRTAVFSVFMGMRQIGLVLGKSEVEFLLIIESVFQGLPSIYFLVDATFHWGLL